MCVLQGGVGEDSRDIVAVCYHDNKRSIENSAWHMTDSAKLSALSIARQTGMPREIVEQIELCDRHFEIGVHYHNIMPTWKSYKSRVVLVGDACHAMPPFMGQGANQAIQDAYVLAERVSRGGKEYGTSSEALDHYEAV